MTPLELLALTLGVGWASGLNLYAAVFTVGLLGAYGGVVLPDGLMALSHPAIIIIAGALYFLEFFADKIPGLDSAWDAVHTFIRIPAGAILAAVAIGPVDPIWTTAAGLLGGSLAAVSHTTKSGSRVLINTSPEPVSNWTASVVEDAAVVGGLWTALNYPIAFMFALVVFLIGAFFFLKFAWRMGGSLFRRVRAWMGKDVVAVQGGGESES